eukprot:1210897-Amphidinium_carterae.1
MSLAGADFRFSKCSIGVEDLCLVLGALGWGNHWSRGELTTSLSDVQLMLHNKEDLRSVWARCHEWRASEGCAYFAP